MIPSLTLVTYRVWTVYQRGLVIDSQLMVSANVMPSSVSKGIGD